MVQLDLTISAMAEYLDSLEISSVKTEEEGLGQEQLIVPLGINEVGEDPAVIILIQEPDEEDLEEEDEEEDDDDEIRLIKFVGVIGMQGDPQTINDLARLVSFFNQMIEFPGFVFSENLAGVNFVYSLPVIGQKVCGKQLVAVIGLIGSMIEIYQAPLKMVATGECTYEQLISQGLGEIDEEE